MTLYVKGFKFDKDKIANLVGAKDRVDPRVETGIFSTMEQLNRSAYLGLEVGYEPAGPDGELRSVLIVALEIGEDKDELKKKELGEIDESIRTALHLHILVGPGVWELWE